MFCTNKNGLTNSGPREKPNAHVYTEDDRPLDELLSFINSQSSSNNSKNNKSRSSKGSKGSGRSSLNSSGSGINNTGLNNNNTNIEKSPVASNTNSESNSKSSKKARKKQRQKERKRLLSQQQTPSEANTNLAPEGCNVYGLLTTEQDQDKAETPSEPVDSANHGNSRLATIMAGFTEFPQFWEEEVDDLDPQLKAEQDRYYFMPMCCMLHVVCMCMCACAHVCMCVCVYVCMCVREPYEPWQEWRFRTGGASQ